MASKKIKLFCRASQKPFPYWSRKITSCIFITSEIASGSWARGNRLQFSSRQIASAGLFTTRICHNSSFHKKGAGFVSGHFLIIPRAWRYSKAITHLSYTFLFVFLVNRHIFMLLWILFCKCTVLFLKLLQEINHTFLSNKIMLRYLETNSYAFLNIIVVDFILPMRWLSSKPVFPWNSFYNSCLFCITITRGYIRAFMVLIHPPYSYELVTLAFYQRLHEVRGCPHIRAQLIFLRMWTHTLWWAHVRLDRHLSSAGIVKPTAVVYMHAYLLFAVFNP